ncbi:hypothetical protein EE612_008237 [Oryza sativa]|nr:hypothetical protein EE612_008237 [Oryza sativa]
MEDERWKLSSSKEEQIRRSCSSSSSFYHSSDFNSSNATTLSRSYSASVTANRHATTAWSAASLGGE